MRQQIKYPDERTYYICLNGSEVMAYGFINPNQTFTSNKETMFIYTDKNEFINKCIELNIDYDYIFEDV